MSREHACDDRVCRCTFLDETLSDAFAWLVQYRLYWVAKPVIAIGGADYS